jgi:tRNA pseudouridine55 synthase
MIDYRIEDTFLLINKPLNWTSFDVVKKLKYSLRPKKIGHAGTLDPLATGLLVLGLNKFTKKLNEVQGQPKTYTGIIEIGKTTPSYDLETAFDSGSDWSGISVDNLKSAAKQLTGEITQVPPAHSAVKVDGVRAYKLARQNEEVKLKERLVQVSRFEITKIVLPEVHFEIDCSKGTYIRSLAHDFGQLIGVGAYLKKLTRTRIGDFKLENAMELEDLIALKVQNENS